MMMLGRSPSFNRSYDGLPPVSEGLVVNSANDGDVGGSSSENGGGVDESNGGWGGSQQGLGQSETKEALERGSMISLGMRFPVGSGEEGIKRGGDGAKVSASWNAVRYYETELCKGCRKDGYIAHQPDCLH